MPKQGKPFILYEGGALPYLIVPRGWKGWSQFTLWLASGVPLMLWFALHLTSEADKADLGAGLFLFGVGALVWLFAGLCWSLPRAELVRMVEVRRRKQYARRAQARQAARQHQTG